VYLRRLQVPKKRSHGDGGLYPIRGGKLWRATLAYGKDPETGKAKVWSATSKTQRGARSKLDAAKAEVAEYGVPLDRSTTVSEWASRWLESIILNEVDPATYSVYATATRKRILPLIGSRTVSSLQTSDVYDILNAARAQGLSEATVRKAYATLSRMLEDARKQRLCAHNVVHDVTAPKPAKSQRGAFTALQAEAIIRAALALPDHTGSQQLFKLLAGPRQGENIGALIDEYDPVTHIFTLEWKLEEVPKMHGCKKTDDGWECGKKRGAACPQAKWRVKPGFEMRPLEGRFCLTRPKSGEARYIPIVPPLAAEIEAHLKDTKDLPNPHGLIWRNPDGSPISPAQEAQQWRNVLYTAGIITENQLKPGGTNVTGHWARHTTITVLASLGIDFQIIGEIVGHSSAEVTQIYRHAQAAERMGAMEALANVWKDALPSAKEIESAATRSDRT
jgi:site-specific recombinase XerD